MEISKHGDPTKGKPPLFSWTENCSCGAVLKVTRNDVHGPRDHQGRLRPSIRTKITCPSCSRAIKPAAWKYAG
jgi:hypothetical protein